MEQVTGRRPRGATGEPGDSGDSGGAATSADPAATRRVALATVAVGAIALAVIAALRVPWDVVPGRLPDVPATDVFTTGQIADAERLARWSRAWSWSSLAVSLAVALWLGFGRQGRAAVARLRGPWPLRLLVTVVGLTLVGTLVTLPFGIALRQLRLDAGLAAGSWAAWAVDVLTADLVRVVATTIGLAALIGCARALPRLWPLVAGLGAAVLVVLGSFVYPVLVEPLSNNFDSLPDGPLRQDVLALARAEGVRVDDVLVADASRRTTTLNAYVSGFGDTRRVVLYDTLVDGTPRAEVLSVVAHELAHARYDDVLTGTALGAAGAMAGVGLLGLLLTGRRRGMSPAEVDTVPRVLALVAAGSLLALPLQNAVSRQLEMRADRTALEYTRDPAAFSAMQERLSVRAKADPTPPAWSQFWFGSHPTVLQRIGLARLLGSSGDAAG